MTRARFGSVVVAAAALLILGATGSGAADPRHLHFAGTVTAVDTRAKTITVRNGKDTRVFATDGLNVPKLRKGDWVSVDYRVAAWKIKRK